MGGVERLLPIFKMADQNTINKVLALYGANLYNWPRFRLVWSDDQLEKRRGTFNEFYGAIFLRTLTGVQEVKKYPYIVGRWVIEMFVPPSMVDLDELPEANQGSYEPIYVFEDSKGNALPLSIRVAELVAEHAGLPVDRGKRRENIESQEAKEKEERISYNMDAAEVSHITNALHMREAIVRP